MQEIKSFKINPHSAIIFGGANSYKTSVLLHYTCDFLENYEKKDSFAYFISKIHIKEFLSNLTRKGVRKNLTKKGFFSGKSSPFKPETMQRIQMIFIEGGVKGLIDFLTNFELLQEKNRPNLLLFDDISDHWFL